MTPVQENHPVATSMANTKQSTKIRNYTRIRWIIAIISSFGVLVFAFFAIKPEIKSTCPEYVQPIPFIQLIDETPATSNRNYEAFFLPTKYNFALKVKPPKANFSDEIKATSTKPIFSQLDRLRILRTFTNRFTESEYWTVSRIQMHPRSKMFSVSKRFIEDVPEPSSKMIEVLEKNYDISTEFLFSERNINEYSK